jgi:heme/copper-type cytochrome/quinol oxidase subunit 2
MLKRANKTESVNIINDSNKNEKEFKKLFDKNNLLQVFWVIIVVLLILIIVLFSKIWSLQSDIDLIQYSINNKKSEISFVDVYYWWKDDSFNNVDWIWGRSLNLPTEAKWKSCVIVWSKISGNAWWTLRQFLWKNSKWTTYSFADNYNAQINLNEQKIEISKWNWYSEVNLSDKERESLYFSVRLLCK